MRVCTGLNWLGLGSTGEFFWTRYWTFGFNRKLWISSSVNYLPASQERPFTMDLLTRL